MFHKPFKINPRKAYLGNITRTLFREPQNFKCVTQLLISTAQKQLIICRRHSKKPDALFIMSTASSYQTKPSSSCGPISPKAKRTVSFLPLARDYSVLHINDFSAREIKSCWCDEDDLLRVKTEVTTTVALVERGDINCDTSEFCRRGTEIRSREGSRRRMLNKRAAWDAVLDEQDRQERIGINDQELIA